MRYEPKHWQKKQGDHFVCNHHKRHSQKNSNGKGMRCQKSVIRKQRMWKHTKKSCHGFCSDISHTGNYHSSKQKSKWWCKPLNFLRRKNSHNKSGVQFRISSVFKYRCLSPNAGAQVLVNHLPWPRTFSHGTPATLPESCRCASTVQLPILTTKNRPFSVTLFFLIYFLIPKRL